MERHFGLNVIQCYHKKSNALPKGEKIWGIMIKMKV